MRRALFVAPSVPWQARSGTEQRTALLYRAVSRLCDAEVLVVGHGDQAEFEPGGVDALLGTLTLPDRGSDAILLRPIVPPPLFADAVDWRRYALVVGRYVPLVARLPVPPEVPTIIDADDAVRRFGPVLPGLPLHLVGRAKALARTYMFRRALRNAAHVFFCSSLDRDAFPGVTGSVLPNIPFGDIEPLPQPRTVSATILFVGSLWYAPNREGVDWFVRKVWPRIRLVMPHATLRLVGGASPEIRAPWAGIPGVEVPGFVEDLVEEYRQAAFTIAPIWHGAGTSIKILESLAYGRICVTTIIGYAPLGDLFPTGTAILSAATAEEMSQQCIKLLQPSARSPDMARKGADVVRATLTIQAFEARVREGLISTLGCSAPRAGPP